MDPPEGDMPTTTIALGGDLILEVGVEKLKLLVSAGILQGASEVFRALLGPHFAEGQITRSSASPQCIRLPDDESAAVQHMCMLLHGKPIPEFERAASHEIYRLAVVVDKYACAQCLRLQSQGLLLGWLDRFDNINVALPPFCNIAASAYLLDHKRAFEIATKRLIMKYTNKYSDVLAWECGRALPFIVILALEEKRSAALRRIIIDLPRIGMPICEEDCDNKDDDYVAELERAFDIPFWPPELGRYGQDVSHALERIRTIGTVRFHAVTCEHTGEKDAVTTAEVMGFAEKVEEMCEGLCLRCVKEGERDLAAKCTEVQHEA